MNIVTQILSLAKARPAKTPSTIELKSSDYIENGDFSALFDLYQKSNFEGRYKISGVVEKMKDREAFDAHCAANTQLYLSHYFQGVLNGEKAANSRGSAAADHTSEEQVRGMFEYSEIALNNFRNAIEIDNTDKMAFIGIFLPLLYLSSDLDVMDSYYQAGLKCDGGDLFLDTSMLNALTDKWLGSNELMFNFARRVVSHADDGSARLAVIPLAHIERWLRFGMADEDDEMKRYFSDDAVRKEIITFYNWFTKNRTKDALSLKASSIFAFAFYEMGDDPRLAREIEFCGEIIDFDSVPWRYNSFLKTWHSRVVRFKTAAHHALQR